MLQLSEIQVLVGEYGHVQTALSSGRSLLHLLDQFSLLVQIERYSERKERRGNAPYKRHKPSV